MRNEVITITPELAKKYLSKMSVNRPCSNRVVNSYADSILKDQWVLNGESIKFDLDGRLVDGQHRLNAVIFANKPMKTLVTYGISVEAFETLDQGKLRTNADIIYIDDNEYASLKASVSSNILKYKNNTTRDRKNSKRADVLNCFNKNAGKINSSIKYITEIKHNNYPVGLQIMVFSHVIFREVNQSKADDFIHKLITGEGLSSKEVIYILRERLIKNRLSVSKRNTFYQIELIFRAFKYYMSGQDVTNLRWGLIDCQIVKF